MNKGVYPAFNIVQDLYSGSGDPRFVAATYLYKKEDSISYEIISYLYTYNNAGDNTQLKTRQTSGVVPIVNEFFDTRGQLRWLRDGDGAVTYYGYSAAGVRTLQVVDVDTTTLPTSVDDD